VIGFDSLQAENQVIETKQCDLRINT